MRETRSLGGGEGREEKEEGEGRGREGWKEGRSGGEREEEKRNNIMTADLEIRTAL